MPDDRWADAASYERFMGRWSRLLARKLVSWLDARRGAAWLEIGCGTGSLTSVILEQAAPGHLTACDASPSFVESCRSRVARPDVQVVVASTDALPPRPGGYDVVVSSLVLNFLPNAVEALSRMREACVPGGTVAACVWDYAGGMQPLRRFWDAAVALDPEARRLDEAARFPGCEPGALRTAFEAAALTSIDVVALTVPTTFASFEDYWEPFHAGTGPAPSYVASLPADRREALGDRLRSSMATGSEGSIELTATAWAIRGRREAL